VAEQEKYQSKKNEKSCRQKGFYEWPNYDILVHENPNIYDDGIK
jgi:hypothetical protein